MVIRPEKMGSTALPIRMICENLRASAVSAFYFPRYRRAAARIVCFERNGEHGLTQKTRMKS
jgi:hypothetical protein